MIKDIKDKNSTYYTHGFHPYPAKFTPQLVNKYFNLYCKPGYKILDPFCGSGTTLVEGVINGMYSVGIDLNPIAILISKANHYSPEDIQLLNEFISKYNFSNGNELFYQTDNYEIKNAIEIPDFPNRQHWFQENVSYELASIKNDIDSIDNENCRNLLICAFSNIIVKASNQDSEVRYSAKHKNHSNGFVFTLFKNTVKNYIQVLNKNEVNISGSAKVLHGNSNIVLKKLQTDFFDFIITSPPYINTFDYYLYHKQRMFWLGYDHKPVRKNEIGNHHRIDTKLYEIAKKEYIASMFDILIELSRVSKPNSKFIMIIGDGIIERKTIDMSEVIIDICKNSNYDIIDIESVNMSDITRSFNKKFSNAPQKEHSITLINKK